jgi:hypothetical protein
MSRFRQERYKKLAILVLLAAVFLCGVQIVGSLHSDIGISFDLLSALIFLVQLVPTVVVGRSLLAFDSPWRLRVWESFVPEDRSSPVSAPLLI